ncbi:uncharacterized protein LOC124892915 [Capsicum annuum]|uniref:uncharacterized protein LOC124892915 n=1 Tax=Capsicum annuum TaxID=4072 RepID=UPI001FB08381|nr:uncharacterized protein LOC124892915 [Capsicum annuum]
MAQFHSREKFKMVTKPDDYLKLWWVYMGPDERKIIRTHVGHLSSLIEMDAWPEIIHVLTTFWDDQNMVFRFGDVELTPTIEEVLICYESIEICFKRKEKPDKNILVPAVWDRQTIKEAFLTDDDTWLGERDGENITFRELYHRFGRFNAFHKFGHKFESETKWKEMRAFAFAVGLLGTMVFPQGENGTIHPRVVTVAHALFFGVDYDYTKVFHNLAPMIVADIYQALGRFQVESRFFSRLQPYITMVDDEAFGKGFENGKYTIRGGKWPFLVLPGLRGTRPYNPGRVLRQFEIKQEAPQIDSMLRFFTEYNESESLLKDDMINGWRRRRWTEVTFHIEHDPEISNTYKEWLKKSLAGALIPGPNVPTGVVDVEFEHQIWLYRLQNEFQKSEIAHR